MKRYVFKKIRPSWQLTENIVTIENKFYEGHLQLVHFVVITLVISTAA